MKRTLLVVFSMTFAFVAGIAYLNRFGIYDHFRQSGQHYEGMAIADCRFHLRFASDDPSLHRDLAHHLRSAITVTFDAPERQALLAEAIREYSEVIRLNPSDADAYSSLAGLYAFYWNDHRTATMLYRKCVAIDPADYNSHYNLAESCDALGNTKEARAHRLLAEQLSRSQKQ